MKHTKRQLVPKSWPVTRKGTKYLITPNADRATGIPILVLLRDILKIAQDRKEVKKAIHEKAIILNGRTLKDEKESASLLDILTIVPEKKNYIVKLSEKGKFSLEEIKDNSTKTAKVIGKTSLKGKKNQVNFLGGINILSQEKLKVDDSCVIDFKQKKITKVLPMKEKAHVLVMNGKYAGKEGVVEKINSEEKMVGIKTPEKKINAKIKQIIIIE